MRLTLKVFACLYLVLAFTCPLFAQTHVSGVVSGVWGPEGNPYIADSTLIVPQDSTLEMLPGVEVFLTTEQYFKVYGLLMAEGTESDSIHFHWSECSAPNFWGEGLYLINSDTCRFAYCVIDTPKFPIRALQSAVKIENCRSRSWVDICIEESSYGLVAHCDIWSEGPSGIYVDDYSTAEIMHNKVDSDSPYGGGIGVNWHSYADVCYNESSGGISISLTSGTVIGNIMNHLSISSADIVIVEDNQIFRDSSAGSGDVLITSSDGVMLNNNTFYHLTVRSFDIPCSWLIEGNEIYESITVEDEFAHAEIIGNLIVDGVLVREDASVDLINNTIVCVTEDNIAIEANPTLGAGHLGDIRNNIILGYNIGGVGINGSGSGIVEYNCIWGFETPWIDIESASSNLLENPWLCGGDPFDYNLQANSPCIDAGDPTFPLDPDFTRCDMGAYFYNQNLDNPPAISSTPDTIATTNTCFYYEAIATDDYGPLAFTFDNLPEWFQEESGPEWVADRTTLSGIVPEDQEDFSFLVIVEDGLGQVDSQWVEVEITDATQLQGIVTGVLTASRSPYVMVDNVIVPEGETLVIEPGVEIRVKRCPYPEGRYAIKVYGQILAQGTEEDSIIFTSDEAEPEYDWEGIQLIHCNSDTSVISYSLLEHSYFGNIKSDSSSAFIVSHNSIGNSVYGIKISNHSGGIIHSNYFWDHAPNCIRSFASSPEIFDNTFADTIYYSSSIRMDSSDCFIHDNFFTGNGGISLDYNSAPLITDNIFSLLHAWASSIINQSNPSVFNNTIADCEGGISLAQATCPIKNNIISQGIDFGVEIYWIGIPPDTFDIRYNNVWGNFGGDFVGCPDYLGAPVMVNVNGDSCDIFFNISEDPIFIGGEPFDFNLALGSPCIDAGIDVGLPYNGIAPDIGALESNYTGGVRDMTAALPGEFYLGQNYPNPFNVSTVITYGLPKETQVKLKVYNILGELVEVLVDGMVEAGNHQVIWNPTGLSSGMYFLRIDCPEDDFTNLRAVVLLK